MARFTAGADEINSGNSKKKAYVVDSRIDMLKMASPMFYSENKDYRWILILLRDSDSVEPTSGGMILKDSTCSFKTQIYLCFLFFPVYSQGEGDVNGTSFLAFYNMAHMELFLFDNSFDAKLVMINLF